MRSLAVLLLFLSLGLQPGSYGGRKPDVTFEEEGMIEVRYQDNLELMDNHTRRYMHAFFRFFGYQLADPDKQLQWAVMLHEFGLLPRQYINAENDTVNMEAFRKEFQEWRDAEPMIQKLAGHEDQVLRIERNFGRLVRSGLSISASEPIKVEQVGDYILRSISKRISNAKSGGKVVSEPKKQGENPSPRDKADEKRSRIDKSKRKLIFRALFDQLVFAEVRAQLNPREEVAYEEVQIVEPRVKQQPQGPPPVVDFNTQQQRELRQHLPALRRAGVMIRAPSASGQAPKLQHRPENEEEVAFLGEVQVNQEQGALPSDMNTQRQLELRQHLRALRRAGVRVRIRDVSRENSQAPKLQHQQVDEDDVAFLGEVQVNQQEQQGALNVQPVMEASTAQSPSYQDLIASSLEAYDPQDDDDTDWGQILGLMEPLNPPVTVEATTEDMQEFVRQMLLMNEVEYPQWDNQEEVAWNEDVAQRLQDPRRRRQLDPDAEDQDEVDSKKSKDEL